MDYSTCCVSCYNSPKAKKRNHTDRSNQQKINNWSTEEQSQRKQQKLVSKVYNKIAHRDEINCRNGRHKGVHVNSDNGNNFVTEPFTFVNVPSCPEQTFKDSELHFFNLKLIALNV